MKDNNKDLEFKIIKEVHSYINHKKLTNNLSLNNGRLGLLLYYSFYSEIFNDERAREIAQSLFKEIIILYRNPTDLDRNFFDGAMSFPYIVNCLTKIGIIEEDGEIMSIILRYLRCNPNLNTSPAIINMDKACFGEALSLISVFREEDSLLCFALKESIINFIDDCERLLTQDVPPIYNSRDMSAQYLHSIYFFLKWARNRRIYPTKTDKLLGVINEKIKHLNIEGNIHNLILYYLYDKTFKYCHIQEDSNLLNLQNLAILGLYSLIYKNDIFDKYFDSIYSTNYENLFKDLNLCGFDQKTILGISIGLMNKHLKIYE